MVCKRIRYLIYVITGIIPGWGLQLTYRFPTVPTETDMVEYGIYAYSFGRAVKGYQRIRARINWHYLPPQSHRYIEAVS